MRIFKITKINLMQWKNDPKYPTVAIYTMLYLYKCLHGLCDYARTFEVSINPWIFPFLMRGGSIICPLMFGFILLIADAPFRNQHQQFILLRTGKLNWLIGQIFYLFLLSVVFTISIYLLSIFCILPRVHWSTDWGSFLTTIAVSGIPGQYGNLDAQYSVMKGSSPVTVTFWTASVLIFVCFLLGMIILLCNLWLGNKMGIVIVSAFTILPKLTHIFQSKPYIYRYLTWVSPLNWVDRSIMGHTGQNLPSHIYGIVTPIVLSLLLVTFALSTIHNCNIDTNKE